MDVDILIEAGGWDDAALSGWARAAAGGVESALLLGGAREISLLAADDARIAALNAEFRDKSTPTNVLSWPALDLSAETPGAMPDLASAPDELGDLALAFETCSREAAAAGMSFEAHVTHLIVHGVLHLLGFDHINDQDAALMEGLESRILAKLGIADPYRV